MMMHLVVMNAEAQSNGFVNIVQLTQESVIPITCSKGLLSLKLIETVTENHFFRVDFNSSYCDAIQKENFTFYKEGTVFPTENTPIYELYAQSNVTSQIKLSTNFKLSNSKCPFVLVVFNDVNEYESFLQNGTWTMSYFDQCFNNGNLSLNISLAENSYYFWGIHMPPNSKIIGMSNITYRMNGSGLRNSTNSFTSLCSITSPSTEATTCSREISCDRECPDICVVGIVLKRNHNDGIRTAKIKYVHQQLSQLFLSTSHFLLLLFWFLVILLLAVLLLYF